MKQRWIWLIVYEEATWKSPRRIYTYKCETRSEARSKLQSLRTDPTIAYWELRKLPLPTWRT